MASEHWQSAGMKYPSNGQFDSVAVNLAEILLLLMAHLPRLLSPILQAFPKPELATLDLVNPELGCKKRRGTDVNGGWKNRTNTPANTGVSPPAPLF